jgi:hypothetical protein
MMQPADVFTIARTMPPIAALTPVVEQNSRSQRSMALWAVVGEGVWLESQHQPEGVEGAAREDPYAMSDVDALPKSMFSWTPRDWIAEICTSRL